MKKNINLDEHYSIIPDKYCWILHYETNKDRYNKKGELVIYKSVDNWYYGSLKQALKSYVDKSLKTCEGILLIINKIERLEEKIDSHGLL